MENFLLICYLDSICDSQVPIPHTSQGPTLASPGGAARCSADFDLRPLLQPEPGGGETAAALSLELRRTLPVLFGGRTWDTTLVPQWQTRLEMIGRRKSRCQSSCE